LTSLRMCGHDVDRLGVVAEAVEQLDRALAHPDPDELVRDWRSRSVLLGQDVQLRSNGATLRAHVLDLDPAEGLIVRTEEGSLLHLPAATTSIL